MFRVRPKKWWELFGLVSTRAFTVIGFVASAAQTVAAFVPGAAQAIQGHWGQLLLSTAVVALVVGAARIFQPASVRFLPRGTNLEIEIKTGDIFDQATNIAIPVNDFFDTSLGRVVSERSVHGQFLSRTFPNDEQSARQAIDDALIGKAVAETHGRPLGAPRRYRIGETATIGKPGGHFILFALSKTNPDTHEGGTSPDQLVVALAALWMQVRACCNHDPVSVPLIGAGASRTGLSKAALIDFLLATAIRAHQEKPITTNLIIVLQDIDLSEIDLFDLKRRYA